MEYDAITAGVDPGGINNSQQVRLLVCYTLRAIKEPVDRQLIPELLQYHALANFFEAMQAIYSLLEKGSLAINTDGLLVLTEQGLTAIEEWEFILPIAVKAKAARAAVSMLNKLRISRENFAEISAADNGFNVLCKVFDGERTLLEVKLWVPDKQQAEAVKAEFINDPAKIYGGIIELFTKSNDNN